MLVTESQLTEAINTRLEKPISVANYNLSGEAASSQKNATVFFTPSTGAYSVRNNMTGESTDCADMSAIYSALSAL